MEYSLCSCRTNVIAEYQIRDCEKTHINQMEFHSSKNTNTKWSSTKTSSKKQQPNISWYIVTKKLDKKLGKCRFQVEKNDFRVTREDENARMPICPLGFRCDQCLPTPTASSLSRHLPEIRFFSQPTRHLKYLVSAICCFFSQPRLPKFAHNAQFIGITCAPHNPYIVSIV